MPLSRRGTCAATLHAVRFFLPSVMAACVVFGAGSQTARADEGHAPTPKRPMPDYDGRGMPEASGDEPGTWVARVLLSPLYLLSEYGIRRPAEALTTHAEHHDWFTKVYDFFAPGPNHDIGFFPVGFVEFGFNPSVGVYGFANHFIVRDNYAHVHVEAWPPDWWLGTVDDHWDDGHKAFDVHVSTSSRPDQVFYGIGPSSLQSAQSRFTERRFDASGTFLVRPWRSSFVQGTVGVRKVETTNGHYGGDPNLEQEAATGAFAIPFGFDQSYLAPYTDVHFALDTRKPKTERGASVRVEADSEQGEDVEHAPATSWIRYGGSLAGTIDVGGHGRLLSLSVTALFADSLGSEPIPFTELVSLGGNAYMRGYFDGRLRGRSAAVAMLRYAWPIAPFLDGTLEAAVGNVFDEHLTDFDPKLLRFSAAFGIATPAWNVPVEMVVGLGTETFDQGTAVDSVRLMIGVPRSF